MPHSWKSIPLLLATLLTASCAELNTAYETRNMQLWIDDSATCPGKSRLKLTGSVYNNTSKDMYVSFEMPTYNTRHERGGAFAYRLLVSPKEWTEVTSNYQDCIDKFDVNRMTVQAYHP